MLEPVETAQKKQTQFIASASHELRTPLAVVRSGLESVEKCSNEEERNHFLHLMSEETVHMKRLIDDMLLLANSDADTLTIKPEACQPDLLLLDTYEKFEPLARKTGFTLSSLCRKKFSRTASVISTAQNRFFPLSWIMHSVTHHPVEK